MATEVQLGLSAALLDLALEAPPSTIAHVDLRTGSLDVSDPSRTKSTHDMALQSIQRTVRADDRVCPYGVSRIGIAFGPAADAVTPKTLGERLARAVGNGTGHARRNQPRLASLPSTMVVTVDRLVNKSPSRTGAAVRDFASSADGTIPFGRILSAPALRHRSVLCYSTCRLSGYGTRHDDNLPGSALEGTPATVLVVDPNRASHGSPGLAAVAASSLAAKLGFASAAICMSGEDLPVLDIDGAALDLVIIVVGPEPTTRTATWSSSTWSVPAQVTESYYTQGVDVLAVGAGAGAGALAACVEQGAEAVADIDKLSAELRSMFSDTRSGGAQKEDGRRIPARFEALIRLTVSERRVLYYLTKGFSAQEIAEELVVSLATVRSHIRSILRKLNVKSQLAAVAIANSRDLEDIAVIEPA
jgi:DNA-binding CsgD family transcriptional regulator